MSFIDSDTTCMLQIGKKMGLIPTIIGKVIEILQMSLGKRSQFEMNLGMRRVTLGSPLLGAVGFDKFIKAHWRSPLGFSPLFLPCRVPMNSSFSLPLYP